MSATILKFPDQPHRFEFGADGWITATVQSADGRIVRFRLGPDKFLMMMSAASGCLNDHEPAEPAVDRGPDKEQKGPPFEAALFYTETICKKAFTAQQRRYAAETA